MSSSEFVKIEGETKEFYVPRSHSKLSPILSNIENDEIFSLLYGEDVFDYVIHFLEYFTIQPFEKFNLPIMYSIPLNTLIPEWYIENFLKTIHVSKIKLLFDISLLLDIEPLIDLLALHISRLYILLDSDEIQKYFQTTLQFPQEDLDHVRSYLQHHIDLVIR